MLQVLKGSDVKWPDTRQGKGQWDILNFGRASAYSGFEQIFW